MTDAPERIWAVPERNCTVYMSGNSPITAQDGPFTHRLHGEASEYIRADLVAALEVENQRLREGLRPFANAGTLFDGLPGEVEFDQCIYSPAAGKEYNLCGDDLRRARAALEDGE